MNHADQKEKQLIERVKNSDKLAFSIIFTHYYSDLVHFSRSITRNFDTAEEIVQDLFFNFWKNRSELHNIQSLKSYFLKSVQNRSIDWLRHESIKNRYAGWLLEHPVLFENETENFILYSELEAAMNLALSKVPRECAEVYRKSRFEALKHKEIAELMGISLRTVEERISRTVRILRLQLRDYIAIF